MQCDLKIMSSVFSFSIQLLTFTGYSYRLTFELNCQLLFSLVSLFRNPEKCFVELYVNSDIGGSIPRSLIEKALPYQQIFYLDCLKSEVKKRLKQKN